MNDAPTSPLSARISNGYRVRLALIGLGLTAFGCWALYDGFVAYPERGRVHAELVAMQAEHEDWASRWAGYAAERGYETNPNEVQGLKQHDILTQYAMAAVCLPIGGFFLFNFLRASGRRVEADAEGIRGREGSASWGEVTDLDDSRWRTKGIAKVAFKKADGAEGRILLDDWKFEREPTVAIHDLAMAKLGKTPEGGEAGETAEEATPGAAEPGAAPGASTPA